MILQNNPMRKHYYENTTKSLTYRNILAHNIHVQFWTFILVADSYVDYLTKNIEIFNKKILKITKLLYHISENVYCIHGYFRLMLFSTPYIYKRHRPILKLPR